MKKAVYLLIAAVVFTSCFESGPETNITYRKLKINKQYRIKVPNYMKKTDELNDEASLQYMNALKETYVIVLDEVKDSFVQIFKDIDEYNDSLSVAGNYKEIQLNSFESFVVDFKSYDEKTVDFNGTPSVYAKVDGIVDNFPVTYFFRFVEGKENIYMLLCWTEKSRKEKYGLTFESVLGSFSEVN